jgi:hypothetical protein
MVAFSTLSQAGQWTWNEATLTSPLPFIPTAMAGWDPRPWNETESSTGDLMWYSRTPQDVAAFTQAAIVWAKANPQLRPEPAPTPPLVLIEAWNELGEGSHVIPTAGDGSSYGDALAVMLQTPIIRMIFVAVAQNFRRWIVDIRWERSSLRPPRPEEVGWRKIPISLIDRNRPILEEC